MYCVLLVGCKGGKNLTTEFISVATMSVSFQLKHPAKTVVAFRAFCALGMPRDPWATLTVTDTHVVLHVASDDCCVTATTALPKALFTNFHATPALQFGVSPASLASALAACAAIQPAKVAFAFPNVHDRFTVEAVEGSSVAQAAVLTRPVRPCSMLDLRFHDSLVPNTVVLSSEVAREIAMDLISLGLVEHINVAFSATRGMSLTAIGSPLGVAMIEVPLPITAPGGAGGGRI